MFESRPPPPKESDIARSRRRADLLAAATGGSAKPALITANLDEIQQGQASAAAVDTFLIPYAQPG